MKIMLAEDEPNIATIAKLTLEKMGGHEVHWVSNGNAALDCALNMNFDVILLDEMMPGLNGLSVCKQYKAQTKDPKPVIFLSAKSQEADIKEFEAAGKGYINKPFDPMSLCSKIEEILKK